jgi:hypothetical protein
MVPDRAVILNFLQQLQPGRNFFFSGIVNGLTFKIALYKKGLNGYFPIETFQLLHHFLQVEISTGAVGQFHRFLKCRIEFPDIVLHVQQGIENFGFM